LILAFTGVTRMDAGLNYFFLFLITTIFFLGVGLSSYFTFTFTFSFFFFGVVTFSFFCLNRFLG